MSDTTDTEVIIDETNFGEYFFDVKKHAPKKGQVLAKFTAVAELVNAFPKDQIVRMLLHNPKGGDLAPKVLRNICNATEAESVNLAKRIAQDLAEGMSEDEVLNKPYEYIMELFFWTNEECVPKDCPNWTTIKMLNNMEDTVDVDGTEMKFSVTMPESKQEVEEKNDDAC